MTPSTQPSARLPEIKFSHRYSKLDYAIGYDMKAKLLHVHRVELDKLSDALLAYDTDDGLYKLPPRGDYLMLFLLGSRGLFITLRRRTDAKEHYYRSLIGRTLAVSIKPEE